MPASDPTPLPVLASSARALAAARPGEEVVVRVAMEPPVHGQWRWAGDSGGEAVFCRPNAANPELLEYTSVVRPAAVGERVAVECPGCAGEAGWELRGDPQQPVEYDGCRMCEANGTFFAVVTAAPEPEAWCEGCGGSGSAAGALRHLRGSDAALVASEELLKERCPTCHGTPSTWVWRVGVTLEPQRKEHSRS